MEKEILKIYTDNGLAENPSFHGIEIEDYDFKSVRMGSPQFTATVMYPTPLDKEWTRREYVDFRGERYYITKTPRSSKSNNDTRYRHELIFQSRLVGILNGLYHYDVVPDYAFTHSQPSSNSTTVKFYGTIREYVDRLNCALLYAGIGDSILKRKTDLTTEDEVSGDGYCAMLDPYGDYDKETSHEYAFEDKKLMEVLTDGYGINEVPFAFRGKRIVFGELPVVVDHKFEYGYDNALLSIDKANANARVINRITMLGSSENIPYYYPNETEYGHITLRIPSGNTVLTTENLEIANLTQLLSRLNPGATARLCKYDGADIFYGEADATHYATAFDSYDYREYQPPKQLKHETSGPNLNAAWNISVTVHVNKPGEIKCTEIKGHIWTTNNAAPTDDGVNIISNIKPLRLITPENKPAGIVSEDYTQQLKKEADGISLGKLDRGTYFFDFSVNVPNRGGGRNEPLTTFCWLKEVNFLGKREEGKTGYYWETGGNRYDGLSSLGVKIKVPVSDAMIGDGFSWTGTGLLPFQSRLMPPLYRNTLGLERFYNAENDTYTDPDTNQPYTFPNPFTATSPSEHIYEDENEKPTIEGVVNSSGALLGVVAGIAFDADDNDAMKADAAEDGEKNDSLKYEHSYFYIRLNIFNGTYGFDLFSHYSQTGPMTIQMTSGPCNGCKFKVQAVEYTDENGLQAYRNPVQTTEANGDIVYGSYEAKVKKDHFQEWQQNTQTHSIWICLQKDAETFGVIMPNVANSYRPNVGDTFNIINIDLPQPYIDAAEKRLEDKGIRFMADNNEEKFAFSIKASRIFFAENPDVLAQLDEYSKIKVVYDGREYEQYVDTFGISCKSGEALPDITLDLADELSVGETFADTVAERAASLIANAYTSGGAIGGGGGISYTLADKRYMNKKRADRSPYKISSDTGFEVGEFVSGGSGGIFFQDSETGLTWIEADILKIRMKAIFEELMISKISTVRGKNMITPGGSIEITFVEEMEEAYRCYFKSKDEDKGADCQFVVGDQIISQEFNVSSGLTQVATNNYYWRLVTAVDNNRSYIDLSKTDFAADSGVPQAGDTICQLGNRTDQTRQSAIILSTVDAFAPCVTLYSGIDSYSLEDKSVVEYGVDKTKNPPEPFFHCYGSFFFGPRSKKSYLQFEPSAETLVFKGKMEISSTIGDKSIDEYIKDVVPPVTQEDIEGYVNAIVDPKIEGIQNQIDGVIETWFYNGVPTLANYPANEWATEDLKIQHLGDLYYDNDTGTAYRFSQQEDKSYFWNVITDDAITKALAAAQRAQDTADGKRRVFTAQPVPPYEIGDLWANATYGEQYSNDLLRCETSKKKGETFDIADWVLASKYTDDALAQEAKEDAAAASAAVTTLTDYVNNEFRQGLVEAFEDGIITATERQTIEGYVNIINNALANITATYEELYGNEFLKDPAKSGLKTAYDDVVTKTDALLGKIDEVIADNSVTQEEIDAVDAAFAEYNTSSAAFNTAVEVANKAIQDNLKTYSETVAAAEAQAAKDAVSALEKYVNGEFQQNLLDAFNDGIITSEERQQIESYIAVMENAYSELKATYDRLYDNVYLEGEPEKESLKTAFDSVTVKKDELIKAIEDTIADSAVTGDERTVVDAAFDAFNAAAADFSTAVEAANEAIQRKLKGYSDAASQAAADAAADAAAAQTAANEAKEAVNDLNTYVDGAFRDGIIDETEAKQIAAYINTVKTTMESVKATYEELDKNMFLEGEAKTGLKTAYSTFDDAATALITAIETAIADSTITTEEDTDVDAAFETFNTAVSAFNKAVEAANAYIQGVLKGYSEEALAEAGAAKAKADAATAVANAAKERLDEWAADGVISPAEKQGIKDEIVRIDADKEDITGEYAEYGGAVPPAYITAHTEYREGLVALSAATPESIEIPADFAEKQAAYYAQRTACYKALAVLAKKHADDTVADLQYLKTALVNTTEIDGGLVLTTLIKLGYEENDVRKILAGMNGGYIAELGGRTIASWYGGEMIDLFDKEGNRKSPVPENAARALFRMDGSGYLSGGNILWNTDGSGSVAGGNVAWDALGAVTIGGGVKFDITNVNGLADTLSSLNGFVNGINQLFVAVEDNAEKTEHPLSWAQTQTNRDKIFAIKAKYGFYTDGFLSAKGLSADGGSTGSGGGEDYATFLENYLGDNGYVTQTWLSENGYLTASALNGYATRDWVEAKGYITASALDGYATQEWVEGKNYLTEHQPIYALTLQAGTFTAVTYNPKSKAATVNIPTSTSHIAEGSNLYFTNARAVAALKSTTDALSASITALDTKKLDKAVFDDLFEKVQLEDGTWSIKAKYGLWTDYFLTAKGKAADGSTSGGGGIDGPWLAENGYATLAETQEWVQKQGYLTSASLSNYVTLDTAQTISGKKTFSGGIAITSGAENPSMPFFLGIDAYADGGTVKYITASKVAAAIGAIKSHQTIYTLTVQKNGSTVGSYTPNSKAATINIPDVASKAALTAHIDDTTAHITADERTKWTNAANTLAGIMGNDTDKVINKWEEIVAFLNTYTEADTLANLLGNKADKSQLADYVSKAGDTMSGTLTVPTLNVQGANPGNDRHYRVVLQTTNTSIPKAQADYRWTLYHAAAGSGFRGLALYSYDGDSKIFNSVARFQSVDNNGQRGNGLIVHGFVTADSIKIGDATISWDSSNGGALKVSTGMYSEGFITAKGMGSGASGGGGIDGTWLEENGYATLAETQEWVQKQGYLTSASLTDYATTAWVGSNYLRKYGSDGVLEVARYIDFHTISNGALGTEDYTVRLDAGTGGSRAFGFPSSGGTLATEAWVQAKGYITSGSLSNYYTKTQADNNYVNTAGDTMTGKLTISMTEREALSLGGATNGSYMSFKQGSTVRGYTGRTTNGTFLQNDNADGIKSVLLVGDDTQLSYKPDAINTPYYTVWHSGNDGSGSGLDADLLDGTHAANFAYRAGTISFKVGSSKANITTAQFVNKLKSIGAFSHRQWSVKCSWYYVGNDVITDTGLGKIELAGSVIEVQSESDSVYTIRVTTSPRSVDGGIVNAVFIYRNHGADYSPNWKRLANTSDLTWGNIGGKPTTLSGYGITDAYTKAQADSNYVNAAGDTMTGDLLMKGTSEAGNKIRWERNTDYAQIWFKNAGDSDEDSYLGFQVGDNGNEYFRFSSISGSTPRVWASLKSSGLKVYGAVEATTVVKAKTSIQIGDATISWDAGNSALKVSTGLYSESFISAKGVSGATGGGGGIDETFLAGYLEDNHYTTQEWVQKQGYLTSASLTDYAKKSWVNQNFVTALGTASNYYLTWTKNGATSNVTVPYAGRTRFLEEATGLARGDNDSSVEAPSSLPAGIRVRFKNGTGSASGLAWATLVDLTAYAGGSNSGAGYRNQFMFSNSGNYSDGSFWVRNGVDGTWNGWRKVLTESNYAGILNAAYQPKGSYVTLNTEQSLSARKYLKGGSGIHMSKDTSNAETFTFRNAGGSSVLGYIGYHNTAGNMFISAKGDNAEAWNDAVGKYQLHLSSAGHFRWNTYDIWHKGNLGRVSQLSNDMGYATQSWVSGNYLHQGLGNNTAQINVQNGTFAWANTASGNGGYPWAYGVMLQMSNFTSNNPNVNGDSQWVTQLASGTNKRLYYRQAVNNTNFGSWATVAFTSDISWGNLLNKPTTVAGFGITDAYTKTEINSTLGKYFKRQGRLGPYNIDTLTEFASRDIQPASEETISGTKPFNNWGTLLTFKSLTNAGGIQIAGGNRRLYYRQQYNGTFESISWNTVAALSDLSWANISNKPTTLSGYGVLTEADNRYVNVSGDTMTGQLTSADILIPTGKYIYGKVVENSGAMLFHDGDRTIIGSVGASTTAATHLRSKTGHLTVGSTSTASYKIWDSGNDGSGSGLDADLLDGYQASWFYRRHTIDASSLSQSTWYPVTIQISQVDTFRIIVFVGLNSGTKPSWSTHANGFSVAKVWTTNGSGWGTIPVKRQIIMSTYQFAETDPVRGVSQMQNSSTEVFYVRGGGKYYVITDRTTTPYLRTSTYTVSNESVAPTSTAPAVFSQGSGITSDFCTGNAVSASKLQTARTIWGQSFNGEANVSGDMTGVGAINLTKNIISPNTLALITSADKEIHLKYSDDNAKAVVLNGTHFKPFNAANGLLGLGSSSAWWKSLHAKTVYVNNKVSSSTTLYLNSAAGSSTIFTINGTEKARFCQPDGWLGIGVVSPQQSIHTTGAIRSDAANAFRAVYGEYGFFLRNDGANTWFMLTEAGKQNETYNDLRPLRINNKTGDVHIGNSKLFAAHDGNVGINTTTPEYPLHVNGAVRVTSIRIGDATLSWDSDNNALKIDQGVYSTGFITAKGVANSAGGQGVDAAWVENYLESNKYATQDWVSNNHVTINTAQTITGAKIFTSNINYFRGAGNGISKLVVSPFTNYDTDTATDGNYAGIVLRMQDTRYPRVEINSLGGTATLRFGVASAGVADMVWDGDTLKFNADISASSSRIRAKTLKSEDVLVYNTNRGIALYKDVTYNGTQMAGSIDILKANGAWSKNCLWFTDSGNVQMAGSLVTKRIYNDGASSSWVKGRVNALLAVTKGDSYRPIWSAKSPDGSWDCGAYTGNMLHFSYITDTNFAADSNTPTADIQFRPTGQIGCKGVLNLSDFRLKDIKADAKLSLDTIADAPCVKFAWKSDPDSLNVGTVAQYWETRLPETVDKDPDGTLSLNYSALGVVMGISLANELRRLRDENAKLKARIEKLEQLS